LPDHVANQIAAGEVVQRPASVVKELLENAIDAGADQITLVIKNAGKTLIQVIDNGSGMNAVDARLSFARHATSKIKQADDLFQLQTKGFRGEALASIAAIAHVSLKTKIATAEQGVRLVIEGSACTKEEAIVMNSGTTVTVKNLFYNIPARRNFLKGDHIELKHIIEEFQRVALAHHAIAFKMVHNEADLFHVLASNRRQRIVAILGAKTNEKLVPVHEETEIVTVQGFVLKPEFAKKSRGDQYFFVNDRFIKSPYLNHAIAAAFEGLIKPGYHPGYVLYLSVPPQTIDINIHPTKTEIKFEEEKSIYALLRATIKHGLGQFNIAPVIDFDRDATLETPYAYAQKPGSMPTIEVDPGFNPFANPESKAYSQRSAPSEREPSWSSLYVGLKAEEDFQSIEFESDEVTGQLFDTLEDPAPKICFQIQNKYVITSLKNGLIVVHQNLAHRRILYERFLRRITMQDGVSQQILFPQEFALSAAQTLTAQNIMESMDSMGFVYKMNSDGIILEALPLGVPQHEAKDIILSLLDNEDQQDPQEGFSQLDVMARALAKHMAIKSGQILAAEAQEHLINELFACKEPSISPENRPTFVTLDSSDFDKKFN